MGRRPVLRHRSIRRRAHYQSVPDGRFQRRRQDRRRVLQRSRVERQLARRALYRIRLVAPWGGGGIEAGGASHCVAGDFNSDGKTDIACLVGLVLQSWEVAYSTGSSWQRPAAPQYVRGITRIRERCVVGEFHGYGKSELLCNAGSQWWMAFGPRGGTDLLTEIKWPGGATANMTYGSSLDTAAARIGFAIPIVQSVSIDDGRGVLSTTSYEYDGGFFNHSDREFRGFNHVRVKNPAGLGGEQEIRDLWFHQGNDIAVDSNDPTATTGFTKGRIYKDRSSDEHFVRKRERTTVFANASGPSRFQPAVQIDDLTCEGDSCSRSVRTILSYDEFREQCDGAASRQHRRSRRRLADRVGIRAEPGTLDCQSPVFNDGFQEREASRTDRLLLRRERQL